MAAKNMSSASFRFWNWKTFKLPAMVERENTSRVCFFNRFWNTIQLFWLASADVSPTHAIFCDCVISMRPHFLSNGSKHIDWALALLIVNDSSVQLMMSDTKSSSLSLLT